MIRNLVSLLFGLVGVASVFAQSDAPSVLSSLRERVAPLDSALGLAFVNPANVSARYSSGLTSVRAVYSFASASDAPIAVDGKGHNLVGADVSSLSRYGEATTLWGAASFVSGQRRGVRFSETSDARLLFPYLLADSVGGSFRHECYRFSGGVGHDFAAASVGLSGYYRAVLESRSVDPRPVNLVSDLTVEAGGAWRCAPLRVGASVGVRKYKQSNEVKVLDKFSPVVFSHLTGLGGDYFRFRNVSSDAHYDGLGFLASLSVVPDGCGADNLGPRLAGRFARLSTDKVLPGLNDLVLSNLSSQVVNVQNGSFFALSGSRRLAWQMDHFAIRRIGTENVFGAPVGGYYPKILSQSIYRLRHLGRSGTVRYLCSVGRVDLCTSLSFGMSRFREAYSSPFRVMKVKDWTSVCGVSAQVGSSRCLALLSADWSHRGIRQSLLASSAGAEPLLWQMVLDDYATLSRRADVMSARANLFWPLGRHALSASLCWTHKSFRLGDLSANDLSLSLGTNF